MLRSVFISRHRLWLLVFAWVLFFRVDVPAPPQFTVESFNYRIDNLVEVSDDGMHVTVDCEGISSYQSWRERRNMQTGICTSCPDPVPSELRRYSCSPSRQWLFQSNNLFQSNHQGVNGWRQRASRQARTDFGVPPDGPSELVYAPDGQTAISLEIEHKGSGRVRLWDLKASQLRAELLPAAPHSLTAEYSPNASYVFIRDNIRLSWWETATGQRIACIDNAGAATALDNGKLLATCVAEPRDWGVGSQVKVRVWDIATGSLVHEWAPSSAASIWGGRITRIVGQERGGCIAVEYSKDGRGGIIDSLLPGGFCNGESQVFLWDVIEQRELACLPHRLSAISQNAQWLVTADDMSDLRVWNASAVMTPRPWWTVGLFAALATLATLAFRALALSVWSQITRPELWRWSNALTAPEYLATHSKLIWQTEADSSSLRPAKERMHQPTGEQVAVAGFWEEVVS
jgi:hypothetical protein